MAIKRLCATKQSGNEILWLCDCGWEGNIAQLVENNGFYCCPNCNSALGEDL